MRTSAIRDSSIQCGVEKIGIKMGGLLPDGTAFRTNNYRVSHLPVHLVWVDVYFECSTVCPVLPGLIGIWQKQQGKRAEPNPGARADGRPCSYFFAAREGGHIQNPI